VKELARRYGVAVSTAHRAIAQLAAEGVIQASRGRRPVVLDPGQAN
jgi:DNA-binding GntR family transcriptional regulator